MQRGPGGTAFQPIEEQRDRELTLGPATLGLLALGLLTLCGVCFVFGYAVGHRHAGSASTASLPPAGTPAIVQPANSQSKPSAGQGGAQPQPPSTATDQPAAADADSSSADAEPVAVPVATNPGGASPATPAQPPVRTALTSQPPIAQPAPAAGNSVQSALAQASGIIVQIAAVSRPEDADVLVGALRKRGYAVAARRDPTDGLLHVQIGPFANRNDAIAMRQKLLNDGYNAIVQP